MKCPVCGAAELVHDTRDQSYTYKGETTVLSAVSGDFCTACGESILNSEESRRTMDMMLEFHKQVNAAIVDDVELAQIVTERMGDKDNAIEVNIDEL